MRGAWLAILLVTVSMAGCFDFLDDGPGNQRVRPADVDDDPSTYRVSSVKVHPEPPRDGTHVPGGLEVESADGTILSVKVYEPITRDARDDGSPIRFPVVYLMHGWGFAKEYFENAPLAEPGEESQDPRVNLMQRFAESGFVTVAYDVRGFGQSGGTVSMASAADVQDFLAVRSFVDANFPNSGRVGVAGPSLGGGMTMRILADTGVVDAAANLFGWVDLYDGIAPGDVPKMEWVLLLYGLGQGGSHGRLHSEVNDWLAKALTRTEMASVEAAMDTRSTLGRLAQSDVPLFLCQGLQESLFPQAHLAQAAQGGFVRSYVYAGGHASEEPGCWDKTLDWMDYFLRGADTQVDAWPYLETVDAYPDVHPVGYSAAALSGTSTWRAYLHEENLVQGPSQRTFTIEQRVASNPFQEPAVIGDVIPANAVPEQLRQDPGAVFFDGDALDATQVILGAPVVQLVPDNATRNVPFQVVATLFAIDAEGNSRLLTRGAYGHAADEGEAPEVLELGMEWTKATVPAGSRLVLKLGANDPGWYFPMPVHQQRPDVGAVFTGASSLNVPLF